MSPSPRVPEWPALTWFLLLPIALVAALAAVVPLAVATAQEPEQSLPHGHFYTQAGGDTADPSDGFPIVNHVSYGENGGQRVRFWDEFQRYGGVAIVGYPASHPFVWDGFNVQVFQKGVFQWRPEAGPTGQAWFMNVFDEFTHHDLDQRLRAEKQVPLPATFDDAGKSFEQISAERLAILDQRPALARQYRSVPDPLSLYGLPTSQIEDFGPFYAVRLQRAAFQEWKVDAPGIARAGEVTVVNAGDLAKEYDLVPAWAEAPLPPPTFSNAVIVYTPGQGQAVRSPVTVVGDAQAFEATVVWELTDNRNGAVLGRGFTTARTCCEWARFSFDLPFAVQRTTDATLAVWGASGRGGDRPGEVRIPLQLQPGGDSQARENNLLIEPLSVQVDGADWQVRVRLHNDSSQQVTAGPSSFGLREVSTGRTDNSAQIMIAWIIEPGQTREETVGFTFPGVSDPSQVRLLFRSGSDSPLALDLPLPSAGQPAPPVQAAIDHAAQHTGVPAANIQVRRAEPREWSDSSLGCPQPGQFYLQVITPGYYVELQAANRILEYHTDLAPSPRVVLCQE